MNESRLSALLGMLQEQLESFRQLLERERACLVTWPVVGLTELTHDKQRQAQALQQLDSECRQLLQQSGLLQLTQAQRRETLKGSSLWQQWQKTQALMEVCRSLNEGNGARLQALSQHTLRLLDVMGAGSQTPSMTYGRAGQYQVGSRRSAIGRA